LTPTKPPDSPMDVAFFVVVIWGVGVFNQNVK
jgi:hypothetical protein